MSKQDKAAEIIRDAVDAKVNSSNTVVVCVHILHLMQRKRVCMLRHVVPLLDLCSVAVNLLWCADLITHCLADRRVWSKLERYT